LGRNRTRFGSALQLFGVVDMLKYRKFAWICYNPKY